jgi:hypothetical protein
MTTVSAFDQTRIVTTLDHPLALEVVLLKHTYILPWSQFLYAEGGNDEIRLTFSTHDVLVKGSNLDSLMAALAANGIARLEEPTRPDRMLAGTDPLIREIAVNKIDENRA